MGVKSKIRRLQREIDELKRAPQAAAASNIQVVAESAVSTQQRLNEVETDIRAQLHDMEVCRLELEEQIGELSDQLYSLQSRISYISGALALKDN